jgi:hypothetical protein
VIAVHHGAGPDRLQVGAGAGLGHGDGGYELARAGLGDPLLLLLFVAVVQEVGNDDVVVQREGRARGDGAALLLDQDGVVEEVDAGAAVLLRHGRAKESGRAGFRPDLAVIHALLVPVVQVRHILGRDEAPCLLLEQHEILGHPTRTRNVEDVHAKPVDRTAYGHPCTMRERRALTSG